MSDPTAPLLSAADGTTMADVFAAAQLSARLPSLPRGTHDLLTEWVARLPTTLTRWVHIERHWWPHTARTDVIVGAEPAAAATLLTRLEVRLRDLSAPLREALTRWAEHTHGATRQRVGRVWLEFDAPGASGGAGPGCFIDSAPEAPLAFATLCETLAPVIPEQVRARLVQITEAITMEPHAARVTSVGWLARDTAIPTVRVCAIGDIERLLTRACGDARAALILAQVRTLREPAGEAAPLLGMVHLDVSPSAVTTVGIELLMRKAPQLRGVLQEFPFFALLAAQGHCPADELPWLRAFAGATRCGPARDRVAVRRVNHVKCVFAANELTAIKAYVAIGLLARRIPRTR